MTIDMGDNSIHDEFMSRELKFTELKKKFVEISGPHVTKDILEILKENYSSVINSKREKDRVKNVEGLLRILEKRDCLRYDCIEPLKLIADVYIEDQILSRCLIDYEAGIKNLQPLTPINHYKYRGEYFEYKETEYLLNLRDDDNDQHNVGHDQHNVGHGGHGIHDRQNSGHQEKKNDEILERLRNNRHQERFFETFFTVMSRWKRKYQRMMVIMMIMGFLVILIIVFVNFDGVESTARDGTSLGAPRGGIGLEHTVNFYGNEGGAVVPYVRTGGSTTSPIDGVQEKVFRRVSENLGKSWRDVARFLGVKESEIDAIEGKSFLETKEKAYEALLIFKSRCDSCNWKIKLHKALEKARRRDLAELVNEIAFPNDS